MKLSSEFHIKDNEFKKLDTLLNNFYNYSQNIKDDVKKMAAEDAVTVAENLADKYEEYSGTFGYGTSISDKQEVSSESRIKLKKNRSGQWKGAPTIDINETKTGFTVKMSGKDILYQEFGTGLIGEESEYPEEYLPSYWKYASGQKILQGGKYKNASNNNGSIPSWYKQGLEEGWIPKSAAVWYSPIGITEGNVAGMFMYETYMDYLNDFQTGNKLQLGRNNLQIYIKNKITKGL